MTVFYAPMIYNPAVHSPGTGFFLPQPHERWNQTPAMDNRTTPVVGAHGHLYLGQYKAPVEIEISGLIVGYDPEPDGDYSYGPYDHSTPITRRGARTLRDALLSAITGPFWLWRYTDRCYKQCILDAAPFVWPNQPDITMSYSLRIRALNPVAQTVNNAYAAYYPYRAFTCEPGGGGGETPVLYKPYQTFSYLFIGVPDVTLAGGEIQLPLQGDGAKSVVRLAILSASGALGTGNTTVRLATAGVGGGGDSMDVTIDETETSGANTDGFDTSASTLYLFLTEAGVHSDIQVLVQVEAA